MSCGVLFLFLFVYLSLAESQGSLIEPVAEKLKNTLLIGCIPADLSDGLVGKKPLGAVVGVVGLPGGDLGVAVALAESDCNRLHGS